MKQHVNHRALQLNACSMLATLGSEHTGHALKAGLASVVADIASTHPDDPGIIKTILLLLLAVAGDTISGQQQSPHYYP